MSKKNLIPNLIMGERASVHSTDPSVTADKIAEAIKNLEYWEPQKQAGRFHSKATSYTINDVHLVAQASTPMRASGRLFEFLEYRVFLLWRLPQRCRWRQL